MDNCNITLKMKQTTEGWTDESELFTKGEYRCHKNAYYIDYDESEATGFDGSHVQLMVDKDLMTMTRTGKAFTSLVFQNRSRHFCHYGTEFGECMVGITTSEFDRELDEKGGRIRLKYSIDVNGGLMSENEIIITVRS